MLNAGISEFLEQLQRQGIPVIHAHVFLTLEDGKCVLVMGGKKRVVPELVVMNLLSLTEVLISAMQDAQLDSTDALSLKAQIARTGEKILLALNGQRLQ